jgi:hypothetical protein
MWVAPNLLTFVGFLCCVGHFLLLTIFDYSYTAGTAPPEIRYGRLQVRAPWGEWVTTDCNLKTTGSKQICHYHVLKTTNSTQVHYKASPTTGHQLHHIQYVH